MAKRQNSIINSKNSLEIKKFFNQLEESGKPKNTYAPNIKDVDKFLEDLGIDPNVGNQINYNTQTQELFRLLKDEAIKIESYKNYLPLLESLQSVEEVKRRATIKGLKNTGSGILESLASWDLKGIKNMAMGNTEENYGNWLNQSSLAKWLKDDTGLEIYTTGDDFGSTKYWYRFFSNMGYSVGIILETLAEQYLIKRLGQNIPFISEPLKATSLSSKVRLFKNSLKAIYGAIKGTHEAYMNGMETLNNVYYKMQ